MFGLELAPILTVVSFVLLIVWSLLTRAEQKHGGRLFATSVRHFLDSVFDRINDKMYRWYVSVTRHKMKLSWYYSIHAVLVSMMAFLATVYHTIEKVVISNRAKAKKIRKEKQSFKKSHLTEIAEHKESTQLTPKEKTRRKNESLKGL